MGCQTKSDQIQGHEHEVGVKDYKPSEATVLILLKRVTLAGRIIKCRKGSFVMISLELQ